MDPKSPNMTAEQSLDLITRMIMEAKGNVQRNNFYFLLWGWVIVLADLGMYVLTILDYQRPYIVWVITIPAWIFTLVKSFRTDKAHRTASHFDRISAWLWLSFGFTIFVLVAFGSRINFQLNPVILTITAIPTFVSGVILKFRPLILGGVGFWIGGVITFLSPMEIQPLIAAVAIFFGYLIPGYLLKRTNVANA
jgi:hypothetical protein